LRRVELGGPAREEKGTGKGRGKIIFVLMVSFKMMMIDIIR
jgi:hypothetical protein